MNKAEWDVMQCRRKDGLVLTVLWRSENGKPIDIHWNGDPEMDTAYPEYIPSGKPWKTHGECDAVSVPCFTTDRNACALVLDKIVERNLSIEFIDAMTDESDPPLLGAGERANLFYGILVDPDTICYCAVKAVEELDSEA